MSRMKKMAVVVLIIALFALLFNRLFTAAFVYEPRLVILMQIVSDYIESHESQFPTNSDELEKFALQKGHSIDDLMLKDFQILYDVKCSEYNVSNGALYDQNDKEVLIISGPYNYSWPLGSLRKRYRVMSVHWYMLLCQKEI